MNCRARLYLAIVLTVSVCLTLWFRQAGWTFSQHRRTAAAAAGRRGGATNLVAAAIVAPAVARRLRA